MEIAIEHKQSKKHQVFELDGCFEEVPVEELTVHIGLDTYKLVTTKSDEELDLEKRMQFFEDSEFSKMAMNHQEFGVIPADDPKHAELLKDIESEMVEKVKSSDALKDKYEKSDDKVKFIRRLMMKFADYIAMIRGMESYMENAKERQTHKCFPIDYCNRVMDVMRNIMNDKYKNIDDFNKDYSLIFQDAQMDKRPNVGLPNIIMALESFTVYMADVMRAGRKVEMYEISARLKDEASKAFDHVSSFRKYCIQDGRRTPKLEDKFADYMMEFHHASTRCVRKIKELDKRFVDKKIDELELQHYVNEIITGLFTKCDELILQYTMDEREELPVHLDSYIVGYYSSIYSFTEKDKEEIGNRYVELYRHLLNLNMQQETLYKEMDFPNTLDKYKKYVEDEYENILRNTSKSQLK